MDGQLIDGGDQEGSLHLDGFIGFLQASVIDVVISYATKHACYRMLHVVLVMTCEAICTSAQSMPART